MLGPGAEGVGGAVEEVGDGGGDVGGLAEGGGPGVEEHVERGGEGMGGEDVAGLVGGEIFVAERAVDCVGDDLELLELGEGFGAGDDVVFGGVGLRVSGSVRTWAATAAMSRGSMGAVGAWSSGQRMTSLLRKAGPHQWMQLEANIPGRMKVDWSEVDSMWRSMAESMALSGLGCWKNG